MKQKPIHSQTTSILYQQPTAGEQRHSFWQHVWVNLKEFTLFGIMALTFWLVIHICYVAIVG